MNVPDLLNQIVSGEITLAKAQALLRTGLEGYHTRINDRLVDRLARQINEIGTLKRRLARGGFIAVISRNDFTHEVTAVFETHAQADQAGQSRVDALRKEPAEPQTFPLRHYHHRVHQVPGGS